MRKILSILVLGILFASCYNTGEPRKECTEDIQLG